MTESRFGNGPRKLATRAQLAREGAAAGPNRVADPKSGYISQLADWEGHCFPRATRELLLDDYDVSYEDMSTIYAAAATRRLGIPAGLQRCGARNVVFAAYLVQMIEEEDLMQQTLNQIGTALRERAGQRGPGRDIRQNDLRVWEIMTYLALNPDLEDEEVAEFTADIPDEYAYAAQEIEVSSHDPTYAYRA